jgi:EAL domain-containing protein (putative c-di-GMP-specific phosphodiesterase class I)/CheY-like chemotaxis protein
MPHSRQPDNGGPAAAILVVDDEDAVRHLFTRVLRRAGFEVVDAENGRVALAQIDERLPAAVVLDNRMPDMTGLEVLTALRSDDRTSTLPVILVTGEDDVDDRVRGLEAGANDFVAKPVHPNELVARVRAQLREQAAWSDAVERSWRDRARALDALSRLTPADSVPEMAERVCATLVALPNVDSAAVMGFAGDSVTVLAQTGAETSRSGQQLPSTLGREVQRRARSGPWGGELAIPGGGDARSTTVLSSFAPLTAGGQVVGVLALGLDRRRSTIGPTGSALATAIDLAHAVTAVLAPALGKGAERAVGRSAIEEIIRTGAFAPVFQPVVELDGGAVVGFEGLTRFADGTRPDVRFGEATSLGLGTDLEAATLASIVDAAAELPAGPWLSLNASPALLLERAPLEGVQCAIGRRLVVELTEREEVDDYHALEAALETLVDTTLAVDDAGAGYASLRHILTLHPGYIKLDMTWVRDLESDTARQAIVAGVNHFARLTDCQVIAEGVETEAEATTLRRLGVALGQGFLFGIPAAVGDLA